MEEKVIGIVGCGLIADTHVEAIQTALPGCSITVCDPLPGKAELLKKKYSLKSCYNSIEEMLSQEKPFSVHILSPPKYHVDQSLKCLDAGAHVLVEKPVSFNVADIDILYLNAARKNLTLCADHILLQQPSVLKMFKKIQLGSKGRILFFNSMFGIDLGGQSFSETYPEGHWKRDLKGGAIIDNLIHPVTLAVELTGKPSDFNVHFLGDKGNIDDLTVTWQGERGLVSISVSSRLQPFRRVTEITTNRQTFVVDHSTETLVALDAGFGPKSLRKLLRNFGNASQLISGTLGTVFQVMRGNLKQNPGVRSLVDAYYKHLFNGTPIPVTEENVRYSTYAIEKIIDALSLNNTETPVDHEKHNADTRHFPNNLSDTKTLITGASGFLGRHICETLLDGNRRIVAQVRRGSNADKIQSPPIERIYAEFGDDTFDYEMLLKGIKEIVHCAHDFGVKNWEKFKKINVDATLALYDAAAKAGCEKFIFISSIAVYGVHQKGHLSVDENTPSILGKSKWDFYVHSKTMTERLLLERAGRGGPKLLIIRPGILYSADGTKLTKKSIPLKEGKLLIMFGKGKNHSPFTRVDVLAQTICKILDLDPLPTGIYNMAGNPEENTKEFIYNRMKELGVNCRFLSLPAFPFWFAGAILEYVNRATFRKTAPKITRYIIDSSTRDIYYDCSKAEKDLGWDQKLAIEIPAKK